MKPTADDVLLSLRRYLAQTLTPADPERPWRIRLEREPIKDEERPVAVIEAGSLTAPRARHAIDQGPVTQHQPLTVTTYPETTGTVRAAGRRARRLEQHLLDVGTYGLDLGSTPRFLGGPARPIAGPGRIPIYDFGDVAVEGTTEERSLPDGALPVGWLIIEGEPAANAIQDPEDARRWTVVWELRVTWERGGRIPAEQVTAPFAGPVVYEEPIADPPSGAFS